MPSLAVLITYYGERELLTRCLRSVLEQPQPPDEILVHDDASPVPAESFIPPGAPVRVIRAARNQGPSRGRNRLLSEATADFVHFHDADDWFHPSWCRVVRAALESDSRLDALFTEVASYRGAEVQSDQVVGLRRLSSDGDLARFCLFHAMLVPSGTYRRSLLLRLGGYREELWQSEDYEFHCRLALAEPRYRVLTEPLVNIALRDESRSRKQDEVWACRLQALRLLFLDFPPKYHRDVAEAALHVGSKLFQIGDRRRARDAFRLATEIGPPKFDNRLQFYRHVATILGPEAAEWAAFMYRRMVPNGVRHWFRRKAG